MRTPSARRLDRYQRYYVPARENFGRRVARTRRRRRQEAQAARERTRAIAKTFASCCEPLVERSQVAKFPEMRCKVRRPGGKGDDAPGCT